MTDAPETRLSLLVRIRDRQDSAAWVDFVAIYAPLVYGLARRHGLQDADAADLTQEVLRAVVSAAAHFAYDPARGTFRGWLFTVARNRIRKLAQERRRQATGTGGAQTQRVLEDQPAPEAEECQWEREYQEQLFEWAAEKVKPGFRATTWQAFWETAVENRDARTVGDDLGMSVGAVYIARSRVLARIREQIRAVQDD
jgi:RNA polymerase sigma-70 factor (ECF subfamily)